MSNKQEYTCIIQPAMERTTTPKSLNDQILAGQNKGYNDYTIDVSGSIRTFPNISVPISAIIDFYKSRGKNIDFIFSKERNSYLQHTMFHSPKIVEENIGSSEMNFPLDKVWRFGTSEGVNALVDSFIRSVI